MVMQVLEEKQQKGIDKLLLLLPLLLPATLYRANGDTLSSSDCYGRSHWCVVYWDCHKVTMVTQRVGLRLDRAVVKRKLRPRTTLPLCRGEERAATLSRGPRHCTEAVVSALLETSRRD